MYGGVAIASAMIFLLTKRLGVKLVETFISREKIDELRFINSEKKLKRLIFILFFIPGTPKDLFTYFAGLTRIKLSEFLVISLIARIPSVVSSTIGGHIIGQENYLSAIILFAVTGLVSLGGMAVYTQIVKRHEKRNRRLFQRTPCRNKPAADRRRKYRNRTGRGVARPVLFVQRVFRLIPPRRFSLPVRGRSSGRICTHLPRPS